MNRKILFTLLGLAGIFLVAALSWYAWTKVFSAPAHSSSVANANQMAITWNSIINAHPVKDIPISISSARYVGDGIGPDHILVYNIGSITSGKFSGDLLAFVYHLPSDNMSASDESVLRNAIEGYAYLIIDGSGTPIAWWGTGSSYRADGYLTKDDLSVVGISAMTPVLPAETFPKELTFVQNYFNDTNGARLSLVDQPSMRLPLVDAATAFPVQGEDVLGRAVVVSSELNTPFIRLPFGALLQAYPEPSIFRNETDTSLPAVVWTKGDSEVLHYQRSSPDCLNKLDSADYPNYPKAFLPQLSQTGYTLGDVTPIYEVDPARYPDFYTCVYEAWTAQNGDTVSFDDFIQSHPVFFWKHPYGFLLSFIRSDFFPPSAPASKG